jgi:hypothetical protein
MELPVRLRPVLDDGNARLVPDYPQLRAGLLLLAHPDVVKPAMAVLALSRFVDDPYYMDKVNDDDALQASTDLHRLEDVCQSVMWPDGRLTRWWRRHRARARRTG